MKTMLVGLAALMLGACTMQGQNTVGGLQAGDMPAVNGQVSKETCPSDAQRVGKTSRRIARTPKEVLYDLYNETGAARQGTSDCL